MKRTEYSEHIEKIRCSDKFKAEMEKKLSAAPLEVHEYEYEDTVEGVERAGKIRISRFGAIAACLLIAGSVGLGFNGMKQIQTTDPSQIEYQELRVFPYEELFDLYNDRQVNINAEWNNINDNMREDLIQKYETSIDELNSSQVSKFFDICRDWTWFTCDPKDMTENNSGSYVNFDIHPEGYERYTGVYYNLHIFNNGDAYFTKYDMSDDSLKDHIESQYCYMLAGMAYSYFRDILKTEEIMKVGDIDLSEIENMNMISYGIYDNPGSMINEASELKMDASDETKSTIKEMLLDLLNEDDFYEVDFKEFDDFYDHRYIFLTFNSQYGVIGSFQVIISENGQLIVLNDADFTKFNVRPEFYNEVRNVLENNVPTETHYEPADQETINKFVDKYITHNIELCTRSQIFPSPNPDIPDSKDSIIYTSHEIEADNINEVIEKMKSVEWEKCDPYTLYMGDNSKYTNVIEWKHRNDFVGFTDNGFLIRQSIKESDNSTECYRPVNQEDADEIINMLYSNMKNASPEDRLLSALSKGYNLRNLKGTYSADFTVPAEISETGESYFVQSSGDIYIDKEAGGSMLEGNGTSNGDERRYLFLSYSDDRSRYDEAHGQGESTAHYNGKSGIIPELDYLSLYKQIASEFYYYYEDNTDTETEIEFTTDQENSDGTHSYSFKIKEKDKERTFEIKVDEQGRLLIYKSLNEEGNVISRFELNDDYIYDIDGFSMPVEFVNNH